jgi:hypothetical protein
MQEGRDFWWDEEAEKVPSYCPCEPVGAEDPLFILYVSTLADLVQTLIPCHRTNAYPLRRHPDPPVNPRESSTPLPDTCSEPSFP